jgi:hypothetical protein
MLKVSFVHACAVALFLGHSVWACDSSDFTEKCEKAVRDRMENYKYDTYVAVPPTLTKDHLKESLDSLQKIFGDEIQMRLYDTFDDNLRVQIWWKYSPTRSCVEFLTNTFINTLDPTNFRQLHNFYVQKII